MRARPAGFTLLELVLAMTGVAMIALICYGAFYVGIRAMERGELSVLTAQRLRVLTDVLVRQVKSTANYSARDSEEELEYPYFVGTPGSMSFITAAGQLGGGGLVRVNYAFTDDPPRLTIEEEALFSSAMLGEVAESEQPLRHSAVLLENFEGGAFSYLAFDDMSPEATIWCSAWDPIDGERSHCDDDMAETEGQLPRAVQISLTGVPGVEGGIWKQVVPLMVMTFGSENGMSPDF